MRFRSEHYLAAAQERRDEAWRLLEDGRYGGALYLTGVSVECLFWAYRTRSGFPFEARHDLLGLCKESGMLEFITTRNRQKVGEALAELWLRWRNNFRYAGNQRLKAEFRDRQLDRGIIGDPLKYNAQVAWDSASYVIAMGVAAWTSKTN
ncbi:MAG: hypothetical protein AMXMBFR64_41730 [Myxococcales bacterium]